MGENASGTNGLLNGLPPWVQWSHKGNIPLWIEELTITRSGYPIAKLSFPKISGLLKKCSRIL